MPKNAKVIKNFFFADAQSAIAPRIGDGRCVIIWIGRAGCAGQGTAGGDGTRRTNGDRSHHWRCIFDYNRSHAALGFSGIIGSGNCAENDICGLNQRRSEGNGGQCSNGAVAIFPLIGQGNIAAIRIRGCSGAVEHSVCGNSGFW